MRDPLQGEWQREPGEYGRRYRMIGNCKEYEPDINGIPVSMFNKREKKEHVASTPVKKNCPFRKSNAGNTDCSLEKCSLYNGGCTLARWKAAKDTEGLQCPFNQFRNGCRKDCALYNDGCTLTGITKK